MVVNDDGELLLNLQASDLGEARRFAGFSPVTSSAAESGCGFVSHPLVRITVATEFPFTTDFTELFGDGKLMVIDHR
jgi:hypothetical protein